MPTVTVTNKEEEKKKPLSPNKSGIKPDPEREKRQDKEARPTTGEQGGVFTGGKTGSPSGVELPSGRIFLGLNPEDVADVARKEELSVPQLKESQAIRQQQVQQELGFEEFQRQQAEAGRQQVFPEQTPIEQPQQAQQPSNSFFDLMTGKAQKELAQANGGDAVSNVFPLPITPLANQAVVSSAVRNVANANAATQTTNFWNGLREGAGFLLGGGIVAQLVGFDFFKAKAPFIQQSFNTLGENVNGIVGNEAMTPEAKLRQLETYADNIAIMESTLHKQSIENRLLSNSKEMLDIQTDLLEKKTDTINAIADVRLQALQKQFPLLDETVLAKWVSEATQPEIDSVNAEYKKSLNKLIKLQG